MESSVTREQIDAVIAAIGPVEVNDFSAQTAKAHAVDITRALERYPKHVTLDYCVAMAYCMLILAQMLLPEPIALDILISKDSKDKH